VHKLSINTLTPWLRNYPTDTLQTLEITVPTTSAPLISSALWFFWRPTDGASVDVQSLLANDWESLLTEKQKRNRVIRVPCGPPAADICKMLVVNQSYPRPFHPHFSSCCCRQLTPSVMTLGDHCLCSVCDIMGNMSKYISKWFIAYSAPKSIGKTKWEIHSHSFIMFGNRCWIFKHC